MPAIYGGNQITFPDGSTQNTAASGFGFKNRIINGAMMIDQRNAGAGVSAADGQYITDRFMARQTQANKLYFQQLSTAPAGFIKSLSVTTTAAYSVASTDSFGIQQNIEGFNVADLGWGAVGAAPVTLSFWVRSSVAGLFGGSLLNSAAIRSYPYSYTINAANTWEQKSITIPGDTSGTWLTDNGIGIRVQFGLGQGPTYSGTAGAWVGTTYLNVTGATSIVGTSGATFFITGVQLEKGSTATGFDYRDYGRELAMCQRYYFKTDFTGTTATGQSSTNAIIGFPNLPQMRALPTLGITDKLGLDSGATNFSQSTASLQYAYSTIYANNFSGLSVGFPYYTRIGSGSTPYATFSAEL